MMVSPKSDCPHITKLSLAPIEEFENIIWFRKKCGKCSEDNELWFCLSCAKSFCGRYVKNHYAEHLKENNDHCICISSLDLSVWCYECKTEGFDDPGSYIESPLVDKYQKILAKFKEDDEGDIHT